MDVITFSSGMLAFQELKAKHPTVTVEQWNEFAEKSLRAYRVVKRPFKQPWVRPLKQV